MGDSLEISSSISNAVNGIALDANEQCLNSGAAGRCMPVVPSDDMLVVKKLDVSEKRNENNTEENDESVPPCFAATCSVDNVLDDDLNPGVKNSDDADVKSSYRDSEFDQVCKTDDSDKINDAAVEENIELTIACTTACDSADGDDLHLGVKNSGDDDAKSSYDDNKSDSSHSVIKMDDRYQIPNNDLTPPCITASDSVGNKHDGDLYLGVKNDDDDATSSSCHANKSDSSLLVSDNDQQNIISSTGSEANIEHCSVVQTDDSPCIVAKINGCAEILNSAADGGNEESQCTGGDPSKPQKVMSPATPETETADSDDEDSLSVTRNKSEAKQNTDEPCAVANPQLQLECEDFGVVRSTGESEKLSDTLTCHAADENSKNSSLVSTSPVSTTDVATSSVITSSVTSSSAVATAVISTPLLSSLNVSGLPSRVPVLSEVPLVACSTGVARPAQRNDKAVVVSVPSATARAGSCTRPVSKALQDVGLLLVSQRVFKNLASIQKHKQKAGSCQTDVDVELLQKLKTSHQNLVARNHGLLTAERKCWCGYRSESLNVIEAHRLRCDLQGRCCYCRGEFVYRTPRQMKHHLWKVHRKLGHISDRVASYACFFCPVDVASRLSFMRHLDYCRRAFSLAANLAPKESDKDIPVTSASKQPVQIPVVVSSTQLSPLSASRNSSASVSSATLVPPAVIPPVNLQFAPAARNPGPATQTLLQIGKQLFTLLPSTTVAASAIALNQSSVKSVSKMALNSAVQTAQNSSLPIMVNNRSTNQAPRPVTKIPATVPRCTVCPVCSAFVKDNSALLVHMHVAHGNTHKLCQYCCSPDVTFPNLAELHSHIAKVHTSDCWICKSRFLPPDQLINHIADRHRVTMFKMLELRRCYLCSSVPPLRTYTAFEEHMMNVHSLQFANLGKLWGHIVLSPNADKNWYAKRNPDGTLECPLCHGQFISDIFLYRHLHLEHNGNVVRLVHCSECGKRMPSNILLTHLVTAHTRKCSVRLSQIDLSGCGCLFVPPVGTKRLKNKKGEPVSSSPPAKRIRAAETVVISDDDDSDSEDFKDHSSDEDFVLNRPVGIQRMRRSVQARLGRRNSSVDDVHEVLESIVDSGESETVAKRSVGFRSTSIGPASVSPSAATQLCNGITEDEVEIIESIVPNIRAQHRRPVTKRERGKPSNRNYAVTVSAVDRNSADSVAVDVPAAGGKSDSELVITECQNGHNQPSTKSKSALAESSVQKLMARDQIMVNSVEEVLEIDGETVLIVHDNEDDD